MTAALHTEDPATAIAMTRCLAARLRDPERRETTSHARRCGWCDYPTDELQAAAVEFREWAQFNDRLGTSGRHVVRYFSHELKRDEQEALIVAAQGFEDTVPTVPVQPVPAPEPTPADVNAPLEEEVLPWLR